MVNNQHSSDSRKRISRLVELIWNDQRIRIQSGEFLLAEDYLEHFPEIAEDAEATVDVVYNEFRIQTERQHQVDKENFFNRFPKLATLLKRQIRLATGINSYAKETPQVTAPNLTVEDERTNAAHMDGTLMSSSETSATDNDASSTRHQIGGYEIGPEIGRGAFAVVYEAWDPHLNRKLAIKIPRLDLVGSSNTNKRMLREAQSAARLYHPSIVAVHEIGEHDGATFIVTDYVDGPTMEQKLAENTPAVTVAAKWAACLAHVLHYAHQNGVIHRDIKPANILIRQDGQLLLTDFGLACWANSASSITGHGDILGTPSYMSPEQAVGNRVVDSRTDIYSLGVVLFRCLTGSLPFDGPVSSILHRVINEPIESISIETGVLPRDLETITLKCLNKEPAFRYQSALDLANDLESYLAGEPISARPVGVFEKLIKHVRRRPRTSALLVSALILLGFVTGGAFQLGNVVHQRNRAQNAEKYALTLTANAEFDAGMLAKQQGRIQMAIKRFSQSLQQGYHDSASAHIQIAECQLISGNTHEAKSHLNKAIQKDLDRKHSTDIAYWECELALVNESSHERVIELIDSVLLLELKPDQREFLLGMQAGSSDKALQHFRSTLDRNPYHHSALRSFLIMSFALARFDDLLREVQISQRLYPEDDDFLLLEALATAANGKLNQAIFVIGRTRLNIKEQSKWIGFCNRIDYVRTKLNNEDSNGQINLEVISTLAKEFQETYLPLIKNRRWYFPPRIARVFVDLPSMTTGSTQKLNAANPTQKLAVLLAKSHPEASLLTLAARACLDVQRVENRKLEIWELEQARDLFQLAAERPGFLMDAHQHALIGVFATALQLARIQKHQVEKNTKIYVEAASSMDPISINLPDRLRTITLALINANQWTLAENWSQRWSELSSQSKLQRIDAFWHLGIVFEKQQRWLELVNVCDKILKLDPHSSVTKDFRDAAIMELRKIRSSKKVEAND